MTPEPRHAKNLHGRAREVDAVVELVRKRTARCVTITGMIGIGKSRVLEEARRRLGAEKVRASFLDGGSLRAAELASDVMVIASPAPLGLPREEVIALGALAVPSRETEDGAAIRRSPAVAMLAEAARIELDVLTPRALHALARVARASDGHPVVLQQLAGWLWLLAPEDLDAAITAHTIRLVPKAFERRMRRALVALESAPREVLGAIAEATSPADLRVARAAVRLPRRRELPERLAALAAGGWILRVGNDEAPLWRVMVPFRAVFRHRTRGSSRTRLTAYWAQRARVILDRAVSDRSAITELLDVREEIVASWEDAHARRDRAELALAAALASIATSGDRDVVALGARIRASIRAHPHARRRARLEIACGDASWFSGDVTGADACFKAAVARARRDRDVTLEAFGWIRRATLGPERGRLDEARQQLEKGTELARRSDEPLVLVLAVGIRGYLLRAAGDVAGALAAFDEQFELARRAGDYFYRGLADASAADCHLMLGEDALGRTRYAQGHRAVKRVDAAWARTLEGYMGLAAWEVGALAEAVSLSGRALAGSVGPRFRVVFAAARAGALAELGEVARAKAALLRAEEITEARTAAAEEALRAAALLVDLATASDAASARAAAARIGRYVETRRAAVSEDERAFVRALDRAVQRKKKHRMPTLPARALEGRPKLARVLEILEARRMRGEVVGAVDIFHAAWPDERNVERVTAEARVRKAVSMLRALGLRGAIVTKDGGYVLRSRIET